MKNSTPLRQTNLAEKILTTAAGAIMLVVGLMFSAVVFAVIVAVGLLLWGYLWWKTRELRQRLRERPQPANAANASTNPADFVRNPVGGRVFEGEVLREDAAEQGEVREIHPEKSRR